MNDKVREKLSILADAAKYDVSCSSSGSKRKNHNKGLGDCGAGICHTYTEDGRCVSLLKILLTNFCIYDCAYCVTRKSNDIKRAAFTVEEVVDLTINFYRRNYIEGLFLSSGIFKNADYTMERLVRIAKTLRTEHKFHEAGLYADRLSMNIEIPTEAGLKLVAPDKKRADMTGPMQHVTNEIIRYTEEKKVLKKVPVFTPAGQSTQMIIGATGESDKDILYTANDFYKTYRLKRVYYSGYVPITSDSRLPQIGTGVPLLRENRLYQADWLLRFYGFKANEILNDTNPFLDTDIDPKLSWALRNMGQFPVDINKADKMLILRVPGIGLLSAGKIVAGRRFGKLNMEHLKQMGVAVNRARYFISCSGDIERRDLTEMKIKQFILQESQSKYLKNSTQQMRLF